MGRRKGGRAAVAAAVCSSDADACAAPLLLGNECGASNLFKPVCSPLGVSIGNLITQERNCFALVDAMCGCHSKGGSGNASFRALRSSCCQVVVRCGWCRCFLPWLNRVGRAQEAAQRGRRRAIVDVNPFSIQLLACYSCESLAARYLACCLVEGALAGA